jgi:hypothetical protein
MHKIARLPEEKRTELFLETAAQKGMTPAIAEKDFWVTFVLERIFSDEELYSMLIFKGGTSLSKVYGLIERFSEDIDLILDWNLLTDKDPKEDRSRRQQEILNKEINEKAKEYIATTLVKNLQEQIGDIGSVSVDENDGYVINVRYPSAFDETYLRPEIRLEIGPLAEWMPNEKHTVTSYSAELFPQLFEHPSCEVPTILAERTFWEKATILHHEANRPEGSLQPKRYSRHYYDLAMMAESPVKSRALERFDLLENVVAFKKRFYPRGWADYDAAKPGTLKLLPSKEIEKTLRRDYREMRSMIYGNYPEFDAILETLRRLEDEINLLEAK